MKLPVYIYGHPVLRRETVAVTKEYPELPKLIDDMFETMYAAEGCGLAAPQVGLSIKLVVIDADVLKDQFPECAGRKMVLINPEIEVLGGEEISRSEGCLSLPGLSENVDRVEHIRLRWLDENFTPHEEEMSGFLSRCVQHEVDHLNGKVYMDHVSTTRKLLIRNKLRNLMDGKFSCDYKVKTAAHGKKR
ncbi:MAG: peptide deformylase [Bacteroides sp.]|nr:peptide deformylase [Bacteroides sp.]MCM1378657.1 peptide deformylase [Bacteroides sp.]MCM1444930.1 peptide deformylase [Prevotella sp.]